MPISIIDLTTIGTKRSKHASSSLKNGAIKHSSLYFFKILNTAFIYLKGSFQNANKYIINHFNYNTESAKNQAFSPKITLAHKKNTLSQKNQKKSCIMPKIIHIKFTIQ